MSDITLEKIRERFLQGLTCTLHTEALEEVGLLLREIDRLSSELEQANLGMAALVGTGRKTHYRWNHVDPERVIQRGHQWEAHVESGCDCRIPTNPSAPYTITPEARDYYREQEAAAYQLAELWLAELAQSNRHLAEIARLDAQAKALQGEVEHLQAERDEALAALQEHGQLTEAWNAGADAAAGRRSRFECPYPDGSPSADAWHKGYIADGWIPGGCAGGRRREGVAGHGRGRRAAPRLGDVPERASSPWRACLAQNPQQTGYSGQGGALGGRRADLLLRWRSQHPLPVG